VDAQTTHFVLWETSFEEIPATIFVTELRSAGLRVKVVGLNGKPTAGAHGLALSPDLTLERALPLAPQARCVIIPYGAASTQRLSYDPRLRTFLEQAQQYGAQLITNPAGVTALRTLNLLPIATNSVTLFPANEALFAFVRTLVASL
jgi:protein deglycase